MWLNQSTQPRVANSRSSRPRHGPSEYTSSALQPVHALAESVGKEFADGPSRRSARLPRAGRCTGSRCTTQPGFLSGDRAHFSGSVAMSPTHPR